MNMQCLRRERQHGTACAGGRIPSNFTLHGERAVSVNERDGVM